MTTTAAATRRAFPTLVPPAPSRPLDVASPAERPAAPGAPARVKDSFGPTTLRSATGASASGVLVRNVNQTKPRAEIKAMQQELNKWRADNQLPAIKENGLFDSATLSAVVDFQKQSGMKPVDGAYGVATRERLALENDTGFKILPTDLQNKARKYMNVLGQNEDRLRRFRALASNPANMIHLPAFASRGFLRLDPELQMKIFDRIERDASKNPTEARNLSSLVASPGLGLVSPAAAEALVKAQVRHPGDDRLEQSLTRMTGSSGFKALSQRQQNHVTAKLATFAGQRDELDNYTNAVSVLDAFAPEARRSILTAVEWRPGDTEVANNFVRLSGDRAFSALAPDAQLDVVQRVGSGPNSEHVAANLVSLHTAIAAEDARRAQQGQDPLSLDVREELLRGVNGRHADATLTSAQLSNVMTLASAPGMDKVDAKVLEFMFDVQAARPDNTQLATDLANLAGDARFRYDTRKARGRIMDVDDAVP